MNASGYWDNFVQKITDHGPGILAAIAILIVAWLIAKAVSAGITFSLKKTRLGQAPEEGEGTASESIASAAFWLILLIAMPAVIGALGMEGLLSPMEQMANEFLAFLPNLFGAALIMIIGYAVAMIARRAVTALLKVSKIDNLGQKVGLDTLSGEAGLSNFLGLLVFVLLIIPVAIAALEALSLASITAPAQAMLGDFLDAVPRILGAAIILALAFIIGRFASSSLSGLLPTLGFDKILGALGLEDQRLGDKSPSQIAGFIAFLAIMIFGIIEAAKLLEFAVLSGLLTQFLGLAAQILLGSAIIIVGIVIARFVANVIENTSEGGKSPMAGIVRIAIIILTTAMGLRQMGVANEIIVLGFGLLLGALALGAAIAIGWGGKDAAGKAIDRWVEKL